MKHLTIFNRHSGSFSRRETKKIHDVLTSSPDCLQGKLVITPSVVRLEELLEEYKEFHPEILGIGGGDGTAAQTLTSVEKIWGYIPPIIAPYALGTMNNWSLAVGLTDGLVDKIKKGVGIGETKPLTLAHYITECARSNIMPKTEKLGLFDLNGEKGFNFAIGIATKLMWGYYGREINQYQRLEAELAHTTPDKYKWIYDRICSERKVWHDMIELMTNGKGDLLKKAGMISAVGTGISGTINSFKPDSVENRFYREPIRGEIYIDGKKIELKEQPLNIYCAAYEYASIGIPTLTPCPSPGARSCEGKMEVILTFGEPLDVVLQLPRLFRGKQWTNNQYYMANELEVVLDTPGIAQLDGDYKLGNRFKLKYDQTLKVISPF